VSARKSVKATAKSSLKKSVKANVPLSARKSVKVSTKASKFINVSTTEPVKDSKHIKKKAILSKLNLSKLVDKGEKVVDLDTRSVASRKITSFMKSKRKQSRSRYIKRICKDPAMCIAFDIRNRKKINEHFDYFSSLQYISGSIKQIGETSVNGFVKEVKFVHDSYSAYAVLKSSVSSVSDNLVYEYLAGQYVNHLCNYLPCFIETYGLFYYKDEPSWELLKNSKTTLPEEFVESLELQTSGSIDYDRACQQSRNAAILLQYIHGAKVLYSFIGNSVEYVSYQMIYQIPYLLYQIYYALSLKRLNFTHYDLHTSNVMLYEPKKGKYIEYIFISESGKEVKFKSPYMAKIIDYGRCFFKWSPEDIERSKENHRLNVLQNPETDYSEKMYTSSPEIYDKICKESGCEYSAVDKSGVKHTYKCGKRYGFSWLDDPTKKTKLKHFISSTRSNVSHDLRLLYIVGNILTRKKAHEFNIKNRSQLESAASAEIQKLLEKVVYSVGLEPGVKGSGTRENKHTGIPDHIHNIVDAEKSIRALITDKRLVQLNNSKYNDASNRLGTLRVYADGRHMKFEK
jgi:hypothetical protein